MKASRSHGFTLMEVMVALAILAIALAAIIKSTAENITNTAYLRDKTLAHWIAMNKLTELQVMDVWQTGKADGKTDFAERTWGWRTQIKNTAVGTVRRVEVDVFHEGEKDHPLATITGFLGSPTLEGPVARPPAASAPPPQQNGGGSNNNGNSNGGLQPSQNGSASPQGSNSNGN